MRVEGLGIGNAAATKGLAALVRELACHITCKLPEPLSQIVKTAQAVDLLKVLKVDTRTCGCSRKNEGENGLGGLGGIL